MVYYQLAFIDFLTLNLEKCTKYCKENSIAYTIKITDVILLILCREFNIKACLKNSEYMLRTYGSLCSVEVIKVCKLWPIIITFAIISR